MRILFFLFLANTSIVFSQSTKSTSFVFSLTVKSQKGLPDIGRDVVFIEANTYERLAFKTDANGQMNTTFNHGNRWLGSVGEMRNCIDLNTQSSGNSQRSFTYDPVGFERENQTMPDRRSINFTMIDQQRFDPTTEPTRTESIVQIVLVDQEKKLYPKKEVKLVCYATQKIYYGVTNGNGGVSFLVPHSNNYEIDVDGVESLKWIDLDARPKVATLRILYQPRMFTEQKEKQFIVQNVTKDIQPSSSHARVKLKVKKDGSAAINEDVYVRMLKSNNVYKAKTNDQGEVTFMLPIRSKYFVDFEYQREADEIDLSQVKGIAFQDFTVNYIVDPKLADIENFIPKVKDLVEYDVQNFVEKQYPEPIASDIDFQLQWGNKFNTTSKEALLEVGIKVKSQMTRKGSDALNICFVVDKSGSMMGEDRIDQLKKSLIQFVQQLNTDDIVSVVVFDDEAVLAVPSEKVGDKKKIIDIIHAIQADGGTNIYNGMVLGFEEVKKHKASNYINRLILLTDGYGSEPPLEVIAKAKEYIKTGIELSAIGIGVDFNQALLSQLASAGGGMLHLAGTSGNIQDAFQRELESILYPMAKKAILTVTYNNKIVYRQLYGYANERISVGQMNVDIPHLFPGLNQMALIKFDLIHPTPEIINEQVVVKLEYIDAVTNKKMEYVKKISPEWTNATGQLDMTIDQEHKKVLAVAIANQSMKNMANSFEAGNKDAALKAVQSGVDQINALFPKAKPEKALALIQKLQEYVGAFETLIAQNSTINRTLNK